MHHGHRRDRLLYNIGIAFRIDASEEHRYCRAAEAWIAFVAPEQADREADPVSLADHFVLYGRDRYYATGLMRLFTLVGLSDR